MQPLLYGDITDWYRLVDPFEDHAEEALCYQQALERAATPTPTTLLDLGCGGGHNAFHLKRRFECTLTDLSERMLDLSRELNPECEHHQGDMRTLRLGRTFDAVLVHDAVMYMTTGADLEAAIRTAFEHTRPGGAAVFAPDCFKETFVSSTEPLSGDDGDRSLRGLIYGWDPDPGDTTMRSEFVYVLREGTEVKVVHDPHVEGLFERSTWIAILESTGYEVSLMPRPLGDGAFDEVFVCKRRS